MELYECPHCLSTITFMQSLRVTGNPVTESRFTCGYCKTGLRGQFVPRQHGYGPHKTVVLDK